MVRALWSAPISLRGHLPARSVVQNATVASNMRNAAVITSILFAAVACDRDSTTSTRDDEPTRVTGSTGTTGPTGATTNVPGEGRGATAPGEILGSTDTIGTIDHNPSDTAGVTGAEGVASRTGDGNAATMDNGTRTGTMGTHGAVDPDDTSGTAANLGDDTHDRSVAGTGTVDAARTRAGTGPTGMGTMGTGTGSTGTGTTGSGTENTGTGTTGVGTESTAAGTAGTGTGTAGTAGMNATGTGTVSGGRGSLATDDDDDDVTTVGNQGATGSSATDATAGQVTGPSGGIVRGTDHELSCNQLIPRAVQRQYLANMTITPMSHGSDSTTSCRIEGRGVATAASVQAWCSPDAERTLQPDAPTSSTVGNTVILVDVGDMQQLTAWDSDSSCQITLSVPRSVNAVALGRRILDALPVTAVVSSRDDG